ncbi:hypothetical protein GW915_07285 [bacterium]|nr:hypothetical protein [bacterium]
MRVFSYASAIMIFSIGLSLQAEEFNFLPSFETEVAPQPIGGKRAFTLGVYSETFIPMGNTFRTQTQTDQSMRYQVPVSFGLEASYGLSDQFEIALAGGYEHFATQQYTGIDSSASATTKQFDRISYRFFPILAIIRMRWGNKNWAPEVQLAAGASLGSIKASSTVLNSKDETKSGPFLKGHASAGYAFSWAEDYSVHFHVGYGVNQVGAHTYESDTSYIVSQSSLHHGVFIRGWARYHF